jgi:hypothetical protein
MNSDPFLVAIGLLAWAGLLVATAGYANWRMRIPASGGVQYSLAFKVIWVMVGFGFWGIACFYRPDVALVWNLIATAFIPYMFGTWAVALAAERRRAKRLGLPEPGTDGTGSIGQTVVYWAIGLLFGLAALVLTAFGVANQLAGNSYAMRVLGLGGAAWFVAIWIGLLGLSSLRRYRRLNR